MHKLINKVGGHRRSLESFLGATSGSIRVASAYVTDTSLLAGSGKRTVKLLTSVTLMDIASGATSADALKSLIDSGVHCRLLPEKPRLHAKVYIFGDDVAVVSSANLTRNALDSNIEVGVELTGDAVRGLGAWFDVLWELAEPVDIAKVDAWSQRSAYLKRVYDALRVSAAENPLRASAVPSGLRPSSSVLELLDRTKAVPGSQNHVRSFLCNTDRKGQKHGPFVQEESMRTSSYALAWTPFDYPSHIRRVKPGDAIFMYANGLGVIGIGDARGEYELLQPGDPDRIRKDGDTEWRIPVTWHFWDKNRPCKLPPARHVTFKDVSGGLYDNYREAVRAHMQLLR